MDSLAEVTVALGINYIAWKLSEARKNVGRDAFFALANEELESNERAYKLIEMTPVGDEDVIAILNRAERFHPGWEVDEHRQVEDRFEIILAEDNKLRPFTYVNKDDGMVYSRTVRSGSTMIDDEYLKQGDPELYDEISFELPWGERVMIPLSNLEPAKLAQVAPYIYRGKPSVSLAAPRQAKPEELADAE